MGKVYINEMKTGEEEYLREFDNIKIIELTEILNKNTTLKRFYPLIPIRNELMERLLESGIDDKYMFFTETKKSMEKLADCLRIDIERLKLFEQFLHLHDFINRKLSDIESVNSAYINKLISGNIKSSKDYLMLCIENNANIISEKYEVDKEDVIRLFGICDLMRLPGVKDIRASLYFDCGYGNLQIFSIQNRAEMKQQIADFITNHNIQKSVPFSKELDTQIAVAKILPHLYFAE